jgi:hypothetical protein
MSGLRLVGQPSPRSVVAPAVSAGLSPVHDAGLRGDSAGGAGGPQGPLPPVRGLSPARAGDSQPARLLPRAPGALVSGARAADLCWAGLAADEAARIGLLGDPGSGKTTAARALAQEYLKRSRGLLAVADSKGERGWPGEYRRSVAHLGESPNVGREIVFSPDAFGDPLSLQEVAAWQAALARLRCRSLVVYDELSDGCDKGEFCGARQRIDGIVARVATPLQRVFTHGRRWGASAIWGAQFAQLVPQAAYECTSFLLVWRQAGNALDILGRRGYLDGGVDEVIRALPGGDVPPAKRGAFVLLRRGSPWDGHVYRFTL